MTPDTALATVLQTASIGTIDSTMFVGPEAAQDASRFPAAAVFVFSSGSAAQPQPYIGSVEKSLYRCRVAVVVRGATQDYQAALVKARAVIAAGHCATVSGYISCYALDSEPNWLGYNDNNQPRFLVNFVLTIEE